MNIFFIIGIMLMIVLILYISFQFYNSKSLPKCDSKIPKGTEYTSEEKLPKGWNNENPYQMKMAQYGTGHNTNGVNI